MEMYLGLTIVKEGKAHQGPMKISKMNFMKLQKKITKNINFTIKKQIKNTSA